MERLSLLNNHFTKSSEEPPKDEAKPLNLMEHYRKQSNIDERYLAKIFYGDYEDMKIKFESILTGNPLYK